MSIEHEDAVRAFFLAANIAEKEHWTSAQIDEVLSHLAPDARYHVFAWQEPFVGHDVICDELLRQATLFSNGQVEFLNFASVGQTVFVDRRDRVTMNGKRAGFHVVGVFEFDGNGKIASWRDYVDSREITAKVGRVG
jgi:limonene-1,2-epoxide hydrolase